MNYILTMAWALGMGMASIVDASSSSETYQEESNLSIGDKIAFECDVIPGLALAFPPSDSESSTNAMTEIDLTPKSDLSSKTILDAAPPVPCDTKEKKKGRCAIL